MDIFFVIAVAFTLFVIFLLFFLAIKKKVKTNANVLLVLLTALSPLYVTGSWILALLLLPPPGSPALLLMLFYWPVPLIAFALTSFFALYIAGKMPGYKHAKSLWVIIGIIYIGTAVSLFL